MWSCGCAPREHCSGIVPQAGGCCGAGAGGMLWGKREGGVALPWTMKLAVNEDRKKKKKRHLIEKPNLL